MRYGGLFSAAMALCLAFPARATAFRTASDEPEFAGTGRVAFTDATLVVDLAPALPSSVASERATNSTQRAMSVWSGVPCASWRAHWLGVRAGHAAPDDGVVTVEFVNSGWVARGFAADAAGSTDVQYTRSSGTGAITDADIFLNAEAYSWADGTSPSLDAVLAHEFGHALGLLHPCEIAAAGGAPDCSGLVSHPLMHPTYDDSVSRPADDDLAGLCFLYPAAVCDGAACASGEVCVGGHCVAPCGGAVCGLDQICSDGVCVAGCGGAPCTPSSCELDADCAGAAHCLAGSCVTGDAQTVDPCAVDADCTSLVCSGARCTVACATTDDCGPNATCAVGACASNLAPFGATCLGGNDCESLLCVRAPAGDYCTRPCGASCPSGYACATASGREVCMRPASVSCNATTGGARSSGWLAMALVSAVALRRRRRS